MWSGDADGAERAGLDELLRSQDAALADQIEALLLDAEAKIIAMGDRWDQVLAAEPGSPPRLAAEELVIALQALGSGLTKAGAKLGVLVLIPSG